MDPSQNQLSVARTDDNTLQLELKGTWSLKTGIPSSDTIAHQLKEASQVRHVTFNTEHLGDWDNGLLVFLRHLKGACSDADVSLNDQGLPEGVRGLLSLATAVPVRDTGGGTEDDSLLSRIGDVSVGISRSGGDMVGFLGEVTQSLGRLARGKAHFRRVDLMVQLQEAGAEALPIVTLINFLIGVIIAFVGAIQLQQFGAEIFVADLVGIAMVREMAPMMTAIIVAGRSGAAFAAQLGTMTVNEEIDALTTAGFSPIDFLVLPRILGLGLMVPLLVLYADFVGILGGATVASLVLDITWSQYFQQSISVLNAGQFALGLIKATIYGVLVALAGCLYGIRSGRNASAVGKATTSAVVLGIVLIISASAITTVIYTILGL